MTRRCIRTDTVMETRLRLVLTPLSAPVHSEDMLIALGMMLVGWRRFSDWLGEREWYEREDWRLTVGELREEIGNKPPVPGTMVGGDGNGNDTGNGIQLRRQLVMD
ncbi:hypothetical protein Tco_0437729 [Tanacetum coccineum]